MQLGWKRVKQYIDTSDTVDDTVDDDDDDDDDDGVLDSGNM